MFLQKGQSSIEIIMVLAAVLSITTVVISNYVMVGETSVALSIAKQSIAEQLFKQPKPYTIKTLEGFGCGTALHMRLITSPNDLDQISFNSVAPSTSMVQTEIANTTSYQSIDLKINEAIVSCP